MTPSARRFGVAVFSLGAFIATSCGGDGTTDAAPAPVEPGPADTGSEVDAVTQLEVLDVYSGESTSIADTVTGDRPVLLWFWAPH